MDKINALATPPEFILHTGDISHLSKPEEFDTVDQVLKSASAEDVFYVPGEHDVLEDDGKQYLRPLRQGHEGRRWYSFDQQGRALHRPGNVMNLKAGGLGMLGAEQLDWLKDDVQASASQHADRGVCAHSAVDGLSGVGLGDGDSAQALAFLKRFGSVTVLNGHIHQVMQKVEGNVTFHTAMSTAFPQPASGHGRFAGADEGAGGTAESMLGITDVTYLRGKHPLAIVDSSLA